MSITFSSCFYIIKSKFDPSIYIEWMTNFISIVNKFNLVIYTDENSSKYIYKIIQSTPNINTKIKIIIKPLEQFYNYKYKDYWIENHKKNIHLNELDKNKVSYACITNDDGYMNYLYQIVNNKNSEGLPVDPIPSHQNSIAGGFFILYKDKIDWLSSTYNNKLELYFKNNYLVKDDQILLVDCVLSDINSFTLFRENSTGLDNWFMFQRIHF